MLACATRVRRFRLIGPSSELGPSSDNVALNDGPSFYR